MTLPKLSTLTHLAVAEGCGGSTMAMQYARDTLLDGGRVIWVCESTPDPKRFSQLFENVNVIALSKIHLLPCGEAISSGIDDATKLSTSLSPQLVVIDDWTPRIVHADKIAIDSLEKLNSTVDNECPILITSSLYGDASGEGEWKIRGEKSLKLIGAESWILTIDEGGLGGVQERRLNLGDENKRFVISDEGFVSN